MSGLIAKHDIKVGHIYVAADGSHCGHVVTDVTTFDACDDVVTTPFSANGYGAPGNRIDAFKLAAVRYSLAQEAPAWMPTATACTRGEARRSAMEALCKPLPANVTDVFDV